MPFSSIYQEGVPSGAHSTRQGLLALTVDSLDWFYVNHLKPASK